MISSKIKATAKQTCSAQPGLAIIQVRNPGPSNAYGKIVPSDPSLPSYVNSARFQNTEYDKLFEQALKASTVEKTHKAFSEAEKVLMDEAPFIILWYGEDMMLVQSSVRQLETNGMRYLDLRNVYFKERTAEEYDEKKPQ